MKPLLLSGIAILASSVAFAQPPAPPDTTAAPRTISLTGCVGGGPGGQSFTLANAMIIPAMEQADAVTPSPVPAPVSSTPTQPPSRTAGATGTRRGGASTAGTTAEGATGTAG